MNSLIIFSALAACVAGNQQIYVVQDTNGNYEIKYDLHHAAFAQKRTADGIVVGSYGFQDPAGAFHEIRYNVGPDGGYRADGDIPRDTPAVLAVRAAHLAEVQKQRAILPQLQEVESPVHFAPARSFFSLPLPAPVATDNTVEIEAAKAQHYAAHQAALARLAEAYARIVV